MRKACVGFSATSVLKIQSSVMLGILWLTTTPAIAAYVTRPSLPPSTRLRAPPLTMGAPLECEQQLDRRLLRACALGWVAVAAPVLFQPDVVTLDVFGLDVSGGYGVEQPAAGFLQLTGTEWALEAGLLLLLSSEVLQPQQATRVGTSIVFAAAGLFGAYAAAAATGLSVVEPAAVAATLGLSAASAATALRPLLREQSARELASSCAADLRALVLGEPDEDDAPASATFYRLSALASVVVGGAFLLSPVSPLAVYEAELPVTYLCRAAFGVYLAFLFSPVQFALGRYAADGELSDGAARRLNLLTAAGIVLLDSVGNQQVRAQEVLTAGTSLPDTFRFEANTTAAFYTALLVAVFYAAQGLRSGGDAPAEVGRRGTKQ